MDVTAIANGNGTRAASQAERLRMLEEAIAVLQKENAYLKAEKSIGFAVQVRAIDYPKTNKLGMVTGETERVVSVFWTNANGNMRRKGVPVADMLIALDHAEQIREEITKA